MTHTPQAVPPRRLDAEHREVDGVRVVTFRGEIDHDVRDQFNRALLGGDGPVPVRIIADLSGVTFLDSSGINVLIDVFQQTSGAGGWVCIAGAHGPVLHVLELIGIDAVIDCYPTTQQALTA
ncbi:STAS domain-containing protein [Streptomyces sp. NPDC001046]|uniref:STAS domain-containing protein n=1 Tax=Streptomyces sp. NPDC001046 TaxID=3364543 RepID=UPI00368FAF8C